MDSGNWAVQCGISSGSHVWILVCVYRNEYILSFRSIVSDCHAQQPSQPDCAQSAEHRKHGIEAQADPRPFVG